MKRLLDPDVCVLPEGLCPHDGIGGFPRTTEWLEEGRWQTEGAGLERGSAGGLVEWMSNCVNESR